MRIASIIGARPQFIKIAPLLRAFERRIRARPKPAHDKIHNQTRQHNDFGMSDIFFKELKIREPDHHLGVGSGPHGRQTGEMLKRIEEILLKEKPDLGLVYGDTNSTLAGALAAAKLHIPVAHVEAGLRSGNRRMPEEVNRVITDHISDFLFCPSETAVRNLKNEGVTRGVHLVGDVMYDSVLHNIPIAEKNSGILKRLELKRRGFALATIHRAENTDDPSRLSALFLGLQRIAQDGLPVVVPLHPRTRVQLRNFPRTARLKEMNKLLLIPPVSYLDMLLLEKNAKVILTDSGGVQKEAFFLKTPCLTLREETEWIETVETGWNVLVGSDPEGIGRAVHRIRPRSRTEPYGHGRAAERIVELIVGRVGKKDESVDL